MRRNEEKDLLHEFKQELFKFNENICALISLFGASKQLTKLYTESFEEVKDVEKFVSPEVEEYDRIFIRLVLKELQFFNDVVYLDCDDQKLFSTKKKLDAGGVILGSLSRVLSRTKLGVVFDILEEIIKLATGLYCDDKSDSR